MIVVLVMLIAAHALCDYPLQGDFLAAAKNRHNPIPGVPWPQALAAHAAIHAGAVLLITGSLTLAAVEFGAHAALDDAKCAGKINFNQDQIAHVLCKVGYCAAILAGWS